MNDNQKRIIKEYLKTKVVHPSFGDIAKKTGLSKSYVAKTIWNYLKGSKG